MNCLQYEHQLHFENDRIFQLSLWISHKNHTFNWVDATDAENDYFKENCHILPLVIEEYTQDFAQVENELNDIDAKYKHGWLSEKFDEFTHFIELFHTDTDHDDDEK